MTADPRHLVYRSTQGTKAGRIADGATLVPGWVELLAAQIVLILEAWTR